MITLKNYKTLDEAYSYFNKKLFDNKLPDCLITFQRHAKARGYHHHEKFISRDGLTKVSEIALNPDTFEDREDIEILSTLVHEQCHVYQYLLGEPPKRGYHNKDFCKIMFDIGLQTSSTGEFGGRPTGQSMSHYIIDGGLFEKTAGAFLLGETKLEWNSIPTIKITKEKSKTREKFVCPVCMQSVQAKKTANIVCGDDMTKMVIEEKEGD